VNPVNALDVIPSKGRRMPVVLKDSEDQIRVFDKASWPCPGCDQVTAEGEEITKVYWAWWHAACARKWLAEQGEAEAWKVIAHQMAAHPSRYKTLEIRAVMEHLLRMVP
jgi:hypothetical protein